MKNFLLISALFAAQATPAQDRFVNHDLEGYYDWFHEQSQVADHYEPNTTLYTFTASTQVHEGPCRDADVLTKLPLAFPVTNLSYDDPYFLPEDEINGYGDFWYHVTGRDDSGQPFQGYIWGADIAKSYYRTDLNKDQKPELVLLGISTQKRKNLRDINAEVRLVQEGQLMTASTIPGLCLFEDCAASSLLRVVHTPQGFPVIEASTMTVGCWAGIEKAFYFYDGTSLNRVYHAEYTTDHEIVSAPFIVNKGASAQICQYSHEGENYTPIWKCQPLEGDTDRAEVAMEAPADVRVK
ncbi:MAG: hypothetical protein RIC19_00910 [Phaeodactylibacter sp.]|uniref:hypothetical protein n=1 Tax=Phaeodactylibacter sp. TaxID=1940289 RepID=UPI0032EDF225